MSVTRDKCRKLYMGHDLLPDEDQEQSLAKHGIEVNIIPDYYYQDLGQFTRNYTQTTKRGLLTTNKG